MSDRFLAFCDWVGRLDRFSLAALVVAFGWLVWMLAVAAWYFYLAARSGAGEGSAGEEGEA